MIGQEFDNYRIEKLIDQGGMADVYLALDLNLERRVILKVLKPDLARDREFVARFHREVQITARINHPHVVHVYGTGSTPEARPYLAMQHIKGGSLHDKLMQMKESGQGMLTPAALRLVRQIAEALVATHQAGIIHRDIKPTNILLHENGVPVLSDLGIASVQNATTKLTQTGTVLGTPHYMSPEQSQNRKIDGRSDLYSLGIILYELLAQKRPFEADSPLVILHQHIYEQPEPLENVRPDLATRTFAVVETCLQKEPDHRFQTAADLVQALNAAIAVESGVAPEDSQLPATTQTEPYPSALTPTRRALRRIPLWAYGLAVFIILLAAGGALWLRSQPEEPAVVELLPTSTAVPTKTIVAANVDPTDTLAPTPTGEPSPTAEAAPTEEPTADAPTAVPSPTIAFASLYPTGLIAFSCGPEGGEQITLSTPDGLTQFPLANQPANSRVPNFSPDGSQIAYRSDESGTWQIYASRIDGRDFRQITAAAYNNFEPTWSPDGQQFVFASDRSGSRELYRMAVDGSEQTRLTFSDAFNDDPAWSVDGWVAFESNMDGRFNVHLITPDDGHTRLFLELGQSSTTPAWSRDGQWLAFEVGGEGSFQIWLVDRDGASLQPLTSAGNINARPTWSPDGQHVAFHSNNQQANPGNFDIWTIHVRSKQLQRITTRGDCADPAWSWGDAGIGTSTAVPNPTPVLATPAPICPLAAGDKVTAGDNARLWTGPDVNTNNRLVEVESGAALAIVSGPISGAINFTTDDVGWWWEVETGQGSRGWLWQERIVECREQ